MALASDLTSGPYSSDGPPATAAACAASWAAAICGSLGTLANPPGAGAIVTGLEAALTAALTTSMGSSDNLVDTFAPVEDVIITGIETGVAAAGTIIAVGDFGDYAFTNILDSDTSSSAASKVAAAALTKWATFTFTMTSTGVTAPWSGAT
jgi:hypothetical protein